MQFAPLLKHCQHRVPDIRTDPRAVRDGALKLRQVLTTKIANEIACTENQFVTDPLHAASLPLFANCRGPTAPRRLNDLGSLGIHPVAVSVQTHFYHWMIASTNTRIIDSDPH